MNEEENMSDPNQEPEDLNEGHEGENEDAAQNLEENVAEFRAEEESGEDELAKTKEQLLRALADAENTRKRAQKEREDASRYAIAGFSKDMLDIADNLRRALDAVPEDLLDTEPRIKNLVDGIQATERAMLNTFEKNGIQKLEPLGDVFDPNFHEVMFETPGTGKPAGEIIQVIEVGYTLKDRLLRPARVGVAKDEGQGSGAEPSPSTETGGNLDTEA